MTTVIYCPYCNLKSKLVNSTEIYHRDYGMIYLCSGYPKCDSYVGVHKGTTQPLGRMANKELRFWKMKAHSSFDPLWKRKLKKRNDNKKSYARSAGYRWLAEHLGVDYKDCHIGMFDVETCKKVVEICAPFLK